MNKRPPPLSTAIRDKIAWAEEISSRAGSHIISDEGLDVLFSDLANAVSASRRAMSDAGITEICFRCETDEGGSCCGAGIENRYDSVLLLINRLLDVKLPVKRYDPGSCFFLGESGCVLIARHTICINYLCGKIADSVDASRLDTLREMEGMELHKLFKLHEHLKSWLRMH